MPLALLALTLSAFAIGTTEFVIVGLLPTIASDLGVALPSAGLLVSLYALGVAVGAPLLTAATSRLPRKTALIALMIIFTIGIVVLGLVCYEAARFGWILHEKRRGPRATPEVRPVHSWRAVVLLLVLVMVIPPW